MFTSDTKQEDGTLKWLNTSSQKETVSTSSTFKKTVKKVEEAYYFVRDIAASGEDILFVGTKKQAQDSIKEEAERVGYVLCKRKMAWRYAYKLQDNPKEN